MKTNTKKVIISLIVGAIIISGFAIPCQGTRYWHDLYIYSLKIKGKTKIITSNVKKMDINVDEMIYINDNIAISEYQNGLFIFDNELKKQRFIKSNGYLDSIDEKGNIIFVESDKIVFLSKEGKEIWNYPIEPGCQIDPIEKMNEYYYIERLCKNNDGTWVNILEKYSEEGIIDWKKVISKELSGGWSLELLGVSQNEVYLIGINENGFRYVFRVDEEGEFKIPWVLESGYIRYYKIAKEANELLFFIEKDRELFLSKYRSDGELVFRVELNGIYLAYDMFGIKKILLDEDQNIYIFGSEESLPLRMYVMKYDEDGNELWTKVLIGDYYEDYINYEIADVQYRGSGEFYVIGSSDRYGWNKGVQTVIVGMDSDGNRQWIQHFHPENAWYLTPLATTLDENGDLFVAGTYSVEEEVIENVGGCGC